MITCDTFYGMGIPHVASFSRAFFFSLVSVLAASAVAYPQETNCPAYPTSARIDVERAIEQDRLYAALQKAARQKNGSLRQAVAVPPSKNFIDDRIFSKMLTTEWTNNLGELTADGDLLNAMIQLLINDDGTLFVLGANDRGEEVIYRATRLP